jgi:hypothetical protein
MPAANKTIGPLHLEDLEPHRFEDLVRQLLYDFRPWRDLEATGRSGSDDGFDARGWEIVPGAVPELSDDSSNEADDDRIDGEGARQWLIQCKREKSIAPTKLKNCLNDLPNVAEENLYGIVFVAACDFSRKTRDAFYQTTRELGFLEVKLWGKAEIEDQLFQPKNDHLLFAYFGISLQVRQRSMKTTLRPRLSTKKAKNVLTNFSEVLIRDATDDRYPYPDLDKSLPLIMRRRWNVYKCSGCFHDGVYFLARRSFAFIDDDGEHWDVAELMDDALPHENPWQPPSGQGLLDDAQWAARSDAMQRWDTLSEKNKAWLEVNFVRPYDSILAIDEEGDEIFPHPHVYVSRFTDDSPFKPFRRIKLENIVRWNCLNIAADKSKRVEFFPRASSPEDIEQNFYADMSKAQPEETENE